MNSVLNFFEAGGNYVNFSQEIQSHLDVLLVNFSVYMDSDLNSIDSA